MAEDKNENKTQEVEATAVSGEGNTQKIADGIRVIFAGADEGAVADKVAGFFEGQGYKLEDGDKMKGKYGTGNTVLRMLFGAFVKRHVYKIKVHKVGSDVAVDFQKDALNNLSGGLIGMQRNTNEFKRLKKELINLA